MLTQDYTKVVTQLLAGDTSYIPNYVYLEFQNTQQVITPPTDSAGRSYYDSLPSGTDYLRIPITIKPQVDTITNQVTYTVLVTSTNSVNGLPFSSTANSKIFGVALVSALSSEDPTRDVVFSREYFDSDKQLAVVDNQTLCFSFNIQVSGVTDNGNPDWITY